MTTQVNRALGMLLAAFLGLVTNPLTAATTYTTINPPDVASGNEDDTSIPVAIDGQNMIGAYFSTSETSAVSGFYYNVTSKALVNINPPGSMATFPEAILGTNAVGSYLDSNFVDQGFLYNLTTQGYTTISPPSATYTECLGLSAQAVVGSYDDSANVRHGFIYNLGSQSFTTIDPPGTTMTQDVAISGNTVVGYYSDANNVAHGFVYNGGAFTVIDPPDTASTYVTSISGNIVAGYYEDSDNTSHGFLYDLTTQAYTTIDPPGTATTYIYAISGTQVVGSYDDSDFTSHGFVYDTGTQDYTTLDPSGTTFTACHGVSNGLVAGQYEDAASNSHYFIATLGVTSSGGGTSTPTAKVTLGSLTATYNGSAHAVRVTTTPAGLSTSVTYNGSANPPTNAGSYPVVATVTTSGYTGFATGTLVIAKAKATVALSALTAAYDGSAQAATATTNPTGLAVSLTYAGDSAEPIAAGKYALVATITDANYTGSANGTFTITPGTATVTLESLAATYDGTAHSATATTTPSNLSVSFTYNGSAAAPTAAGNYKVVGTVSDTNYTGSATGTLVIAKALADVTITPSSLSATYTGKAIAVTATSNPAATVTYTYTQNGKTVSPVGAGTYDVTATVSTANAAGSATGTLTIGPASATVTLGSLTHVYTGKAISATATTVPAKLAVSFSYDGSSTAPSATGAYLVVGTITNPNYTGSATGTLTITPVPPIATTGSATRDDALEAIISATVNPESTNTSAYLQYYYVGSSGTVTSTTNSFSMGAGNSGVFFAVPISGLVPGTLYHFQVIASNGVSTVAGALKTFTTLAQPTFNPPAPAPQAPAPQVSALGVQVSFGINVSGVATTVQFRYGTDPNNLNNTSPTVKLSGKTAVITSEFLTGLTPGVTYYFEVTATNGTDTFTSSVESFTTLGFETSEVAATGTPAPDTGLNWATLGSAAINIHDGAAFRATLAGAAAASNTGIWANLANADSLTLVAQTGTFAPDANGNASGAIFSALTDPVYNALGDVAFGGTLKVATGTVTATNENGVWASDSGTLSLVAREGSVAPGTGGALFATFAATAISDDSGAIVVGELTASASLGVTAANNLGVWEGANASALTLMLRTGETVSTTAGTKTIGAIPFPAEPFVSSQTRAFGPITGHLAVTTTFSDKTTGIIAVTTPESPEAVATAGDVAVGTSGATLATFGSPAINDEDEVAFYATLKAGVGDATTKNDSGIWAGYDAGTPALIARLGEIAQGTGTSATFLTFSDPVENASGDVAFRATLSTGTNAATATTNTGIWCNSTGALALVARTGGQAPGCATGVVFSALTELALDDHNVGPYPNGVIFLATLTGTGVSAANNTAIFAQDYTGTLDLMVRTGDVVLGKTITALNFLPVEAATGNAPVHIQGRSVSRDNGDLIYDATFNDKSQAIFDVVFPDPPPRGGGGLGG